MHRLLTIVLGATFIAMLISCSNLDAPSGTLGVASLNAEPPDLVINKAPAAVTSAASVTFEFGSSDPRANFECSINGEDFTSCRSPLSYANLLDGNYRVNLRACNSAGDCSDVARHQFQVNRTALAVQITTSIPAFTNVRTYSIQFAKTNANALALGFQCKLDALDYVACHSPFQVANLNEGGHLVQIRAQQSDGNDSSPALVQWHIDLTPPIVSISGGPNGAAFATGATTAAAFAFFAVDVGGSQIRTLQCQVDGLAAINCATAATFVVPVDGRPRTFTIRATDNAGNETLVTRNFSFHPDPGGVGGVGGGSDSGGP